VVFHEYAQKMKKDFIWFLANIYILANKKEFDPFIKENVLIFYNFLSGLSDDLINEFADVIKAIK